MEIYEAMQIIRYEDLPQKWQAMVDQIGMERFLTMCYYFGGCALHLPKFYNITMGIRDREIRSAFDGGNYRKLAFQFHLSDRQIRKIVDRKRT